MSSESLPNRKDVRKGGIEEKKAIKVIFEGKLDTAKQFEAIELKTWKLWMIFERKQLKHFLTSLQKDVS